MKNNRKWQHITSTRREGQTESAEAEAAHQLRLRSPARSEASTSAAVVAAGTAGAGPGTAGPAARAAGTNTESCTAAGLPGLDYRII